MQVYRDQDVSFLKVSRIPGLGARQNRKCVVSWRNSILQQLEYSLIVVRCVVCLHSLRKARSGNKAQFKNSHVSRNAYVCISCFL